MIETDGISPRPQRVNFSSHIHTLFQYSNNKKCFQFRIVLRLSVFLTIFTIKCAFLYTKPTTKYQVNNQVDRNETNILKTQVNTHTPREEQFRRREYKNAIDFLVDQ